MVIFRSFLTKNDPKTPERSEVWAHFSKFKKKKKKKKTDPNLVQNRITLGGKSPNLQKYKLLQKLQKSAPRAIYPRESGIFAQLGQKYHYLGGKNDKFTEKEAKRSF